MLSNHFCILDMKLAKLLICKITFNGPAPCVPSPSSDLWGCGRLYIFNIAWTP